MAPTTALLWKLVTLGTVLTSWRLSFHIYKMEQYKLGRDKEKRGREEGEEKPVI